MYFTGRLTADAVVRNVKGDRKVTGFNVAINDRFKTKDGEKREITTFVECSYWVNPGLAEYLKKGGIVEIAGRVEPRAWMKDGQTAWQIQYRQAGKAGYQIQSNNYRWRRGRPAFLIQSFY
jgi:single stranded DNA-binding protein